MDMDNGLTTKTLRTQRKEKGQRRGRRAALSVRAVVSWAGEPQIPQLNGLHSSPWHAWARGGERPRSLRSLRRIAAPAGRRSDPRSVRAEQTQEGAKSALEQVWKRF